MRDFFQNTITVLALILALVANAKAAETLTSQEAKLVKCWQEAASTGSRFTIQEKEILVKQCLTR